MFSKNEEKIKELVSQLEVLESSYNEFKASYDELEASYSRLLKDHQNTGQKLASARLTNETIQKQLVALQEKVSQLNAEKFRLTKRNDFLLGRLREIAELCKEDI
jgi:chromosome segregation ATPase